MNSNHAVAVAERARLAANRASYYAGQVAKTDADASLPVFEILHKGTANAALRVELMSGQTLVANSGALVYSDGGAKMDTSLMRGGFFKTIKRAMGGASMQQNKFTCNPCPSWVVLNIPGAYGDVLALEVKPGQTIYGVQHGFLASTVNIDTELNLNLGTHLTATARPVAYRNNSSVSGMLFIKAFGGVVVHDVPAGKTLLVDQGGYLLSHQQPAVRMSGGLKTFVLGGEGFLYEFQGPQQVHVQTVEHVP